jgi:hypothetical protein
MKDEQIKKLMTAARTLNVGDLAVVANGQTLAIVVVDNTNPSSNRFEIVLGECDKTLEANFKTENLKMIAGDYVVDIASRGISRFAHVDDTLLYYLALEKTSKFE